MSRKVILRFGGVIVALGAVLSAVVLVADDPFDFKATWELRGRTLANAYTSSTDNEGVALTIDGHPVSVVKFLEVRARMETDKENIASVIGRVVPDDDPSLQESSWLIWDEDATYPEEVVRLVGFRYHYDLYERHSTDARALSALMVEYAPYVLGVKAGFTMSDEEIQAGVEEYRTNYNYQEQNAGVAHEILDPETGEVNGTFRQDGDYVMLGYIDSLGDKFWTTQLPDHVEREGIATKWRMTYLGDSESLNEANRTLVEITKQAVLSVDVEITGEVEIDATVNEAIEYYLDWEREYLAHLEQPSKTFSMSFDNN